MILRKAPRRQSSSRIPSLLTSWSKMRLWLWNAKTPHLLRMEVNYNDYMRLFYLFETLNAVMCVHVCFKEANITWAQTMITVISFRWMNCVSTKDNVLKQIEPNYKVSPHLSQKTLLWHVFIIQCCCGWVPYDVRVVISLLQKYEELLLKDWTNKLIWI